MITIIKKCVLIISNDPRFLYRFCVYGSYQILKNHLLVGVFISSIQKIKVRVKVTAAQCDVKTLLFFALHIHQTLKR